MPYRLCRHIKTNGLQCHSPALDHGQWCYFHHRLHGRHQKYRPTEATHGYLIPGQHIELTALDAQFLGQRAQPLHDLPTRLTLRRFLAEVGDHLFGPGSPALASELRAPE